MSDLLDSFPILTGIQKDGTKKVQGMDKTTIANLTEIMRLKYPHVCMSYGDFSQFVTIPANAKNFYICQSKAAGRVGKRGFLVNPDGSQTTIWAPYWGMDNNTVKIAFNLPVDTNKGWSEAFSFVEEDSPMKIYKMMKLKAFW